MAEENRLFQVEIITPDRVFYTGEGDMIEFTTASGEIGVYKKHIPLTTVVAPGIVKIHKNRAEAARQRAEERLAHRTEAIDVKRAEFALRKALVRIDIAK